MKTILDACEGFPVQTFEPGASILQENLKDGAMRVLKSGVVDVTKRGTQINRLSSPGSVLGEVAILLDKQFGATVTAVEKSEVYLIENAELFLQEHPEVLKLVARLLAYRLRNMTEELVEIREQLAARDDDGNYLGQFDSVLQRMMDHHLDREY